MRRHRRGSMLRAALVALCLAGAASVGQATTYVRADAEGMVLTADLVMFATVSSVTSVERDGRPWTVVQFTEPDVLKDAAAEEGRSAGSPTVELSLLGGSALGLPDLFVGGLPRFMPGERWLVLAYEEEGLASPIVGVAQGAWRLADGQAASAAGRLLTVDGEGVLRESQLDASAGTASTEDAREASLREAIANLLRSGLKRGASNGTTGASLTPREDTTTAPGEPPAVAAEAPHTAPAGEDDGDLDEGGTAPAPPSARRVGYRVGVNTDFQGSRAADATPEALSALVASAARTWESAAPGVLEFAQDPAARWVVSFGSDEVLGPDAVTLSLASNDGTTEVLVSQRHKELREAALLHELGLLLGLPEGGAGVMGSALTTSTPGPSPSDVAQLREQQAFAPEDQDRSGRVDFYDLVLFGKAYGQTGINLPADFNGDGRVDDADLALLRAAYEFVAPQEELPAPDKSPERSTTAPDVDLPPVPAPLEPPAKGATDDGPTPGDAPSTTP